MRGRILFFMAAAAFAALSLAGCGGDGGGGAASAPVVVSKGVITATGSITVNDAVYDLDRAAITLDGLPGSQGDLQVGMVVTVKGIFDNRTSHTFHRKATRVEFADNLEGPVDSVNNTIGNSALIVMGQNVIITPGKTVFGNFTSLGQLHPTFGNISSQNPLTGLSVVQVSGLPNGPDGFLQASRVDLIAAVAPTASTPIELKGTISALATTDKTFSIGALTVDYSTINPVFLPNPLRNGQFVEVQGLVSGYTTSAAPTLIATGVKLLREGVAAKGGNHVVVEGFVSGLFGNTFTIEGTAVNAGTISLANIANATKVRVEGTYRNGVVQASKITLL